MASSSGCKLNNNMEPVFVSKNFYSFYWPSPAPAKLTPASPGPPWKGPPAPPRHPGTQPQGTGTGPPAPETSGLQGHHHRQRPWPERVKGREPEGEGESHHPTHGDGHSGLGTKGATRSNPKGSPPERAIFLLRSKKFNKYLPFVFFKQTCSVLLPRA